ncbi:hypothetical protein RhiJN_10516 [Ceratobasidium sp. AG-Ba]|nr:hypothetical protein RhiJN_10516 [Ceratobasidium sp. AG-Ba]
MFRDWAGDTSGGDDHVLGHQHLDLAASPSQQDQVVDISRCDYRARVYNWHPANPETQSKMCEPTGLEN